MGRQIALRRSRKVYHLHDLSVLVVLLIRYHHGGAARSLLAANGRVAVAYVPNVSSVDAHIHDCKIDAFMELVEQLNGQHALVFYAFQHDRDRLVKALANTNLRVRVYSNAQDEADWNNGEIDILLAHPASCGYGLNLQRGGHHAIWFGLTWSLEQYEQANKRLHRQGQEHPVVIHHLIVQGGMDEAVLEALHDKGDMQNALLNALRVRISKIRR